MTEAEVKRCREAFRMFDKDNSGTIDVWELAQALETSLKKKPTQEEVRCLFTLPNLVLVVLSGMRRSLE